MHVSIVLNECIHDAIDLDDNCDYGDGVATEGSSDSGSRSTNVTERTQPPQAEVIAEMVI